MRIKRRRKKKKFKTALQVGEKERKKVKGNTEQRIYPQEVCKITRNKSRAT